jgi:hypothetical protein
MHGRKHNPQIDDRKKKKKTSFWWSSITKTARNCNIQNKQAKSNFQCIMGKANLFPEASIPI